VFKFKRKFGIYSIGLQKLVVLATRLNGLTKPSSSLTLFPRALLFSLFLRVVENTDSVH